MAIKLDDKHNQPRRERRLSPKSLNTDMHSAVRNSKVTLTYD
jgi:hypothetical protein